MAEGARYLKFRDGESKRVTFLASRAEEKLQHWIDGQPEECQGEGCDQCRGGLDPVSRYSIRVVVGDQERLWEYGRVVARRLKTVLRGVISWENQVVTVEREGEGLETVYTITGEAEPVGATAVPERVHVGPAGPLASWTVVELRRFVQAVVEAQLAEREEKNERGEPVSDRGDWGRA